jgi:hypothetical protein
MRSLGLNNVFNLELNSKVSNPFLGLNNNVKQVNQRQVNQRQVNQRHATESPVTTTQVNVTASSYYPYFFDRQDDAFDQPEGLFNKLTSFSTFKPENKLFYPVYKLRNDDIELPNKSNDTVPGPYPYGDGIDKWALDNKYNVGSKNYSGIILHFGHTHIMSLHNKIQAIRANSRADVESQTKVLDHLLYASTRIFLKFAGLIDEKNKPLEIDPIEPSGQLKILFKMMITGYGTKAVGDVCGEPSCDCSPSKWSGVMDPMGMLNTLRQFVNNFIPNSTQAPIYCNTLEKFLKTTLKLDTSDPITFMSWYQLLDMHQKDMFESYIAYKTYYRNKSQSNKNLLDKQNKMSMHGGAQLGAFFGFFYTGLIILDTILDERSIPFEGTYLVKFKRERNNDPRDINSWDVIDEGIAMTRQNKTALYNPYAYIKALNDTMSIPNAAVIDAISSYANLDDSKYSPYITRDEDKDLFSNNLIKKGGTEGIKWGLLSNLNFPIDAPYFNKSLLANIGDPTNFVSFGQIGSLITLMGYSLEEGIGIPQNLVDSGNSIAWTVKKDDKYHISVLDNRQTSMVNKDLACYIPSTGKYFRIIISNEIPSDPLSVDDEIIESIEINGNVTTITQTKTIVKDPSGNPYEGGLTEWSRSEAIKLDSAVPGYKLDSLEMILYSQARWWNEHVLMFDDYCNASALKDDKKIYSVSVNMLESCAVLGVTVGRIFEVCDLLIRNRDVFNKLDALKPISNLSVY